MYRGAWQEFDTWEIEMAVPLSPQEVITVSAMLFLNTKAKRTGRFSRVMMPESFGLGRKIEHAKLPKTTTN